MPHEFIHRVPLVDSQKGQDPITEIVQKSTLYNGSGELQIPTLHDRECAEFRTLQGISSGNLYRTGASLYRYEGRRE